MWRDFLKRVWGPQSGWAFIAVRVGTTGEFKQRAYVYPGQLNLLVEDIVNMTPFADVYFCPHLFDEPTRQKKHSLPVSALWADKDSGSVSELVPKPTVCWQTSTGRYQALWLLEEPVEPAKAERINKLITYKSKADKGGWGLTKVLRLPGSINHKYTPPEEGLLLWDDGPSYSFHDLENLFKKEQETETDVTYEQLKEALSLTDTKYEMPKVFPSGLEVIKQKGKNFLPVVWSLLSQTPGPEHDWSDSLWRLEKLLYESGLTPPEVFAIVKISPWDKYARDGRPDHHLWAEVMKAYTDTDSPVVAESKSKLPWKTMSHMMFNTDSPHWLVEGIWMEGNVGWIAGVGKSFKSTLSLDLALSIASGKPFLGYFKVTNPGPVLMIQEEDPEWRVAHRIRQMVVRKGITIPKLIIDDSGIQLIIPSTRHIPLYVSVGGGFQFQNKDMLIALEEAIAEIRPRIVFLDPFFMLSTGFDEYKAGDISQVLNLIKYWRNKYDCAFAVIHHYSKAKEGNGTQLLYGSMALYAWSENSLFFTKEGTSQAGVSRVLIHRDIKDAPPSEPVFVEFTGNDEDGLSYEVLQDKLLMATLFGDKATAFDRIIAYAVTQYPEKKVILKGELVKALGISEKSVAQQMKVIGDMGLAQVGNTFKKGSLGMMITEETYMKAKAGELGAIIQMQL